MSCSFSEGWLAFFWGTSVLRNFRGDLSYRRDIEGFCNYPICTDRLSVVTADGVSPSANNR